MSFLFEIQPIFIITNKKTTKHIKMMHFNLELLPYLPSMKFVDIIIFYNESVICYKIIHLLSSHSFLKYQSYTFFRYHIILHIHKKETATKCSNFFSFYFTSNTTSAGSTSYLCNKLYSQLKLTDLSSPYSSSYAVIYKYVFINSSCFFPV